mgnify:CR=1 FL=1
MDEQYQVKKFTSTTVLGTFTKNQIDNLWDEAKLGGTDLVLYHGEWIQISQLDPRINAFEEEKRKAREEEEEKRKLQKMISTCFLRSFFLEDSTFGTKA